MKIWLHWKAYGTLKLTEDIEKEYLQVDHLVKCIKDNDNFYMAFPSPHPQYLNVCFY